MLPHSTRNHKSVNLTENVKLYFTFKLKIIHMARNILLLLTLIAFMQCKQDGANNSSSESSSTKINSLLEDGTAMWVGTYTRKEGHVDGKAPGVYFAQLDPTSGEINLVSSFEAGINPSYLTTHPVKNILYVVNETGGSEHDTMATVRAYEIDTQGNAKLLNKEPVEGAAPCFVSTNKYGTYVYVANYVSGNVTIFPVMENGALGPRSSKYQFTGKSTHKNQNSPHAHQIIEGPDGRVYVADLGTDKVHIYLDEGGRLKEDEIITLDASSGPRHIAFALENTHMYILNELSGTIDSYELYNSRYKFKQRISTIENPSLGPANSAQIVVSSDQKFLYASNRGEHNNIAIFSISMNDGELKLIGHQKTLGLIPRDFAIDPSGTFLVVANQDSDQLVSFRIDRTTGLLSDPKINSDFQSPVCVKFM